MSLSDEERVVGDPAVADEVLAAIVEATSRDSVDSMIAGTSEIGAFDVEIVALHQATGFPISFGRPRGHLAAWEKLIGGSRS